MLDYYLRSSFPHLILKPWKPGNDFPWPENTGNTSHSRPSLIMRELKFIFDVEMALSIKRSPCATDDFA